MVGRCFYIFIFCSGKALYSYLDNDNPTVASDVASENIFTVSNFWIDFTSNYLALLNFFQFSLKSCPHKGAEEY